MVAWILILIAIAAVAGFLYIKKVPHGWLEFKSGIIVKFLPALDAKPIETLRPAIESFVAKNAHKLNLPVRRVEDLVIPTRHGEIGARIYDDGDGISEETIFFIHGGGWCICSIDTHNEQIRRITRESKKPVVAINYSLSPESKFPVAFEESVDALLWLESHAEQLGCGKKFIPMGDSAGGNIAITTTFELLKLGRGDLVSRVVAIYPAIDARNRSTLSHQSYSRGYYLTGKAMDAFAEAYLRSDDDRMDPRVSPCLEKKMSWFPPIFILTAEFDPLRDEGEAFAHMLSEAGVAVQLKRYKSAIHGFFGLKDFGKKGLIAVKDIAEYLV